MYENQTPKSTTGDDPRDIQRMKITRLFQPLLPRASLTGSRKMSSYNILFPGQGSQYVGMTEQMQAHAGTKDIFQKAHSVLGYDLRELCLKGPQSELDKTVHCQPAVVVGSLVALKQLEQESPEVHTLYNPSPAMYLLPIITPAFTFFV